MNILVVGKGGREHALISTLKRSTSNPTLFACPGSDAIAEQATCLPFTSIPELVETMREREIDLCVAGEEAYLAKGLADACEEAGIPIWGPRKKPAHLEVSKIFAKEFMERHQIPSGTFQILSSYEEGMEALSSYPTVLKYNGLAAGKGVAVCFDEKSAVHFLDEVFNQERFGQDQVFMEEFLEGKEISVICAVSGNSYMPFTPARDYKRLLDHDEGPNTGGMGAVASKDLVDQDTWNRIIQDIVEPTVAGMEKEGFNYKGFLYFGIILTEQGPKMLEYNCRFGDPEAQAVLALIEGDFASFLYGGATENLDPTLLKVADDWSVCLVLAGGDYPAKGCKGAKIEGLEKLPQGTVFHAGTQKNEEGHFETAGGRVLSTIGRGSTREQARENAYEAMSHLSFEGAQHRKDIAQLHFE